MEKKKKNSLGSENEKIHPAKLKECCSRTASRSVKKGGGEMLQTKAKSSDCCHNGKEECESEKESGYNNPVSLFFLMQSANAQEAWKEGPDDIIPRGAWGWKEYLDVVNVTLPRRSLPHSTLVHNAS